VLPFPGRVGADDSQLQVRVLGLKVFVSDDATLPPRRVQAWP
jgi:hypothetical protein